MSRDPGESGGWPSCGGAERATGRRATSAAGGTRSATGSGPKTFRRKVDVEQFSELVDADAIRGLAVPTPADGTRRVGAIVERWYELHAPTLKAKTADGYASLVRARIVPGVGHIRLAQLRGSDVQMWINAMVASGLSASRVRQAHVLLAQALDWAVRDGLLAVNPARFVELPRLEKRERPWLEPATIDELADACAPPNDLIVRLMGYQGLRFGELAGLRRRNIDLLDRRLSVTDTLVEIAGRLVPDTPKSHQARVMPLVDHLVEPLERHLANVDASPDAYLFEGARGGLLRYTNWLQWVWKPACEQVGLSGVTPHALRHSTGKMLANAGVPTLAIKLIMGHASAAFTMDVYGHASPEDLAEAADALAAYRRRSLDRLAVTRISPDTAQPRDAPSRPRYRRGRTTG